MQFAKFVRITALILSLVLTVCLTGCNMGATTSEIWEEEIITVSGNQTESDITTSAQSGTAQNTTSTKTENNTGSKFDLKGKSVIMSGWTTGFEPQKTDKNYKERVQRQTEIEKKYNCKIVYKNSSESLLMFDEWSTATMAGQRFSDITLMASDQYFPQCALRGFLTQLDGRIDMENPCWNYDVFRATELKGKHYYAVSSAGGGPGIGVVFNKEIFSKFSVDNPYTYVSRGTWNWENFRKLAIECTRKDGDVQYYGLSDPTTKDLIRSNGAASSYMKNGKAVFGLDTPECLEAMEFARKLYNDDKVCPTDNSITFESGCVAMTTMYGDLISKLRDDIKDKVGFAYMPKGPATNDYYYTSFEMGLVGVTSLAIDPDACAAILQDWYELAPWMPTMEQSIEDYAPDETAYNIMVDCGRRNKKKVELVGFYNWYWRNVWWTDLGIKSNTSPRTYVDSIKDASQASIDEVWNLLDSFE